MIADQLKCLVKDARTVDINSNLSVWAHSLTRKYEFCVDIHQAIFMASNAR